MGQTIISFLTEIRLFHGKIFLTQYPEKKISEIALLSGFRTPVIFAHGSKKAPEISKGIPDAISF
jgi:AraC-like DNA-binding protein